MDHFGPGLIILLIVLGWVWQGIKALSRAAAPPGSAPGSAPFRPLPPVRRAAAPPPAPPPAQASPPFPAAPPLPVGMPAAPVAERRLSLPFGDRASVREAIIAAEILGPPVALR
ncbi:MAG TPA: hypothetical protein VMA36_15790 [Candidatus Limnocylindria bacterium]|jgi:hypothetical protein|nr:hypothetical protein [Candidatus Limnocylindria bacterium]